MTRKDWFRDKIGKRIFRIKSTCPCESCLRVHREGIEVLDEDHADYLTIIEAETGIKYFDNVEERDKHERG